MKRLFTLCATLSLSFASTGWAQDVPAEYQQVLTTLGKQGDYKANVLKVNIPRNDLNVTVATVKTPTPFGFGGWVAMTKGTGGMDVMMGDLVLTQDEVNPVMSALLDNGIDVTAVHNHFFWEEPRVFYMHVHGHGKPADLARKVKPALDLIGRQFCGRRNPRVKVVQKRLDLLDCFGVTTLAQNFDQALSNFWRCVVLSQKEVQRFWRFQLSQIVECLTPAR